MPLRGLKAASLPSVLAPLALVLAAPLLGWLLGGLFFRDATPTLLWISAGFGLLWAARRLQVAGVRAAPSARQTAVMVAVVALLLLPFWPAPQGDEPHYLLVAHSLVEDIDLDVADEYGERVHAGYHPDRLSPHYKPGLREGSRYSMHGVGYPLLLAPAYALGASWSPAGAVWAARLLQVAIIALFAAVLHALLVNLAGVRAAAVGAPLAVLTVPLLLAPLHLFPETATMTAAAGAYLLILRGRHDGAAGALLATLPWLGVKYIPLALAVAVAGWFAYKPTPRRLLRLLAPLVAALLAHALFTWVLYGSLSPSAVYLGSDSSFGRQPGFGNDWRAYLADWPRALATFVGFFLDQKEGLLAVAPAYLLAAAGLAYTAHRRPRVALGLVAIVVAHLAPYALSQQLGGHSPPARPVTPVLWALAPALALGLVIPGDRWFRFGRGALVAGSVVLTVTLARDPTLLPHDYPVKESWLLRALSPEGADLWRFFPQWVNSAQSNWTVTLGWLAVVAAVAIGFARIGWRQAYVDHEIEAPGEHSAGWWGAAAALGLGAVLALGVARMPVTDRHVGNELAPGVTAWVRARVPESGWAEPGGVWVRPGAPREVVLTSSEPLGSATIHLRVLVPARVRLEAGGRTVHEALRPGAPWRQSVELGEGFPWRGGRAYRLRVGASAGGAPALLEGGEDWRQLGVALRLERDDAGR